MPPIVYTQMFSRMVMMANKQMKKLRIAPHDLLVLPPIKLRGHPAVRPDVPPEGAGLGTM